MKQKLTIHLVTGMICLFMLTFNLKAIEYLQVGSTTRSMIVHAPAGIEPNRPLVINMHGLNQDAGYQQAQAQWEPIADAERFVVVYPNGLNNSWDLYGNTDIDFILAIIDNMASRYSIDRNRVYLSGFSMGGMMTYFAATRIADQIAAFAPVSGYLMGGPNTNSSRPIPLIHVHGTADDVVTYSGVQTSINAWVSRNNCPSTPQVTDPYPSWKPNSSASRSYWGPGDEGSEIVLITLEGKGHWWSMDAANSVSTSQEIWDFCKNFSLQGGDTGGSTSVWLEAECGSMGSMWNTLSDGSASQDEYITIQSGNNSTGGAPSNAEGHVSYNFNVGEAGSYMLWARTIAPSPNDDSFWIRMDNGSWFMWNNISASNSWSWDDCQEYNLTAGAHTLTIAYREDGTLLDKLYITNTSSTPSQEGGTATNCSSTGSSLVNNGIYEIEFQTDPNKVLDLRWGEDANGGVLRPWDRNGAAAQQWIAVDAGNGYWRFISNASASNRCIDLESANTANGTSIRLWDNYNNDAQAWLVTDAGNGYYSITSRLNTSKGWDVPNCVMDGNENLQLWDYYGTSCQLFKFNYISTKSARGDKQHIITDVQPEIYPMPSVDGSFTIDFNYQVDAQPRLAIYNLNGKKVFELADLDKGKNNIRSGLPAGLYIIKLETDAGISTRKLVVK